MQQKTSKNSVHAYLWEIWSYLWETWSGQAFSHPEKKSDLANSWEVWSRKRLIARGKIQFLLLDLGKFGFLLIYGRFGLIYGGTWSEQTYSPPKKNQILLIPGRSGQGRDL